ncbi:hypothetical protein KBK24_0119175 [Burkholderia sp. K24]|nr:hypothetical protein KBK24_0119175 [Burkholderia sp. K24]
MHRLLGDWGERLNERSATWDLETVKHLVILNAAGFAGIATILAGNRPIEAWVGRITLLGYGFGVVLAVLNMYLASVSFGYMADEINRRIAHIYRLSEPTDSVFDRPVAGRRINITGQVCGWLSAVLAITSTLLIGLHLAR